MTTFQIVEARSWHCGAMARLLRAEHWLALARVRVEVHHELRACFEDSAFCRAWLIDGKLAALGGVRGTLTDPLGYVWLALSARALKFPVAVVREARRQLDEIMATRVELATTLLLDDEAAIRFSVFLGFHVDDDGPGARAWSRQGRQDLIGYLQRATEQRVRVGHGYAVAVGYHHEAA